MSATANGFERLDAAFGGIVSFLRSPYCPRIEELDADIAILGVPSDEGSPWMPGPRHAPRSIREMSIRGMGRGMRSRGYYDPKTRRHYLSNEMARSRIVDCGDVDVIYTNIDATFDNISTDVSRIRERGALPVIVGGDHAITYPVVRGIQEPLDILHFDAHLDYRPFEHGVTYTNGTPMRLAGELPHVGKIVQAGIRSLRQPESEYLASEGRGNTIVGIPELRERGPEAISNALPRASRVYVSIDIDVLDMPLVPGCSSAEVGGLDYPELLGLLEHIASQYAVAGFDVVEVNPLLDVPARNTSLIAAQLIQEFLGHITDSPLWSPSGQQ